MKLGLLYVGTVSEVSADGFESALRLNHRSFTFANGSLAFAYATRKAKGQNHGADDN